MAPEPAPAARTPSLDFDRRPLLVFWETTRACLLSCRHCRASALPHPLPGELTREEGLRLIEEVAAFGKPHPILVLTGGDVLMRRDAYELAAAAVAAGIPTCLSPSVTPMLNREAVARLKELSLSAVSISLDGATAATHEGIRGVEGQFGQTLEAIAWLREAGLRVQVNTAVMRANVEELPELAALVASSGAQMWEVFFLVGVGRGARMAELTPAENEDVCHLLYDASRHGFVVRTVEAPFFRRVSAWRRAREQERGRAETAAEVGAALGLGDLYTRLRGRLDALLGPGRDRAAAHTVSTRDGKGVVFVAHDGEVYPAGFLQLRLGNVRDRSLLEIYRDAPVLRKIRAGVFAGRCGACSYRDLCGGSRARAYAASGDPLGEDPGCAFAGAESAPHAHGSSIPEPGEDPGLQPRRLGAPGQPWRIPSWTT